MQASVPQQLVNGAPQGVLSTLDRGLSYGDGLFETMYAAAGAVPFWPEHLARLRDGCGRLGMEAPDTSVLTEEVHQLAAKASKRAIVKLIVTRGVGGRGYRVPAAARPTRILQLHPWPDYPAAYASDGVAVRLCQTRLGINPALAGIKHLNRLEQVLARAEWQDEYAEGLMLDVNGRLVEGTMSNLFLVKGDTLVTPRLDRCGVRGIMRGLVMCAAQTAGAVVEEIDCDLADLRDADGVFLTNAVFGIWPVCQFVDMTWAPHPVCAELRRSLGVNA